MVVQPTVGLLSQWGSPLGAMPSSILELQGYAFVVVAMLAAAALSLLVQDTQPRNDQGGLMAH